MILYFWTLVYSQYGASTAFKPHQTLRQLLVAPKDKASDEEKSGVVYRYPCKGCDKVYIGETKRSLGDRIKEHCAKTTSNQSALAEHSKNTGHELDTGNVTVLCREDRLIPRKVREAIFIKKELKPTLNRDGGRELSKIYDSLLATPSVRTPPTSRSRGSSVSQHSATNRWRRSRVTLKYSETKCECWRSVLIYLLMFNTNTYKSIHSRKQNKTKQNKTKQNNLFL